eukprot:336771-Rhodomonas_salina.1
MLDVRALATDMPIDILLTIRYVQFGDRTLWGPYTLGDRTLWGPYTLGTVQIGSPICNLGVCGCAMDVLR